MTKTSVLFVPTTFVADGVVVAVTFTVVLETVGVGVGVADVAVIALLAGPPLLLSVFRSDFELGSEIILRFPSMFFSRDCWIFAAKSTPVENRL